jgi:hypothetical protein
MGRIWLYARVDVSWTNQSKGNPAMSVEAKLLHLQSIQILLAPYRYLYCVYLEGNCDELGE